MPVRKFRAASEMESSLWRAPGDPTLFPVMAGLSDLAERLCARRFPPGVYRHRSIDDAQALVDEWDAANFRAFWERKRAARGRSEG